MSTLFKNALSASIFILFIATVRGQAPPKQWDKTYGGSAGELFGAGIQTNDGGYISAGSSQSPAGGTKTQGNWDASLATSDYWIVKSDALGNVQWEKTFGGTNQDICNTIVQTSDGGYLLGGYSSSAVSGDKTSPQVRGADYWILKLDASGIKQWEQVYGGSSNDYLTSLVEVASGGYLLAGFSTSGVGDNKSQPSRGANDYWVVRIDASGNQLWDKTFGGTENDYARCVQQTIDGGFIIGGNSQSDIGGDKTESNHGPSYTSDYWVVKIDEIGMKQWDKRFGTSDDDIMYAVRQCADGGYILGGYSDGAASFDRSLNSRGGYDYWVVRTTTYGVKQWDARYGNSGTDYLYDLQITADGGFIFAGTSDSPNGADKSENTRGTQDFWIVKTNASGVKQWDKTLGSTNQDWLSSVRQTADGGYFLGGYSQSPSAFDKTQGTFGSTDFWVIKLGPDPVLPVLISEFSGKQTDNYNVELDWVTASEINNNFFTVEKLISGVYVPLAEIPGAGNSTSQMYYRSFDKAPESGSNYYRLRQTDNDGHSETFGPIAVNFYSKSNNFLSVYPNPANDRISITSGTGISQNSIAQIFNEQGQCVQTEKNLSQSGTIAFSIENIPEGIYLINIESDEGTLQQKFEVKKN